MRCGLIASLAFLLALCSSSHAADYTNQSVFLQESVRIKESIRSMDSLDNKQKLGPGDRIAYRVIEDQDDPKSLLVTDSGDLEVPYLGLVHAAGKTCMGLAREVKALLEKDLYFRATVMISAEVINKTRATGKVYVTGQVRNSGGFDVPASDTLTVSRAILNAGGFSDFSDKKNVRLIRKMGERTETRTINVQEVLEKGKLDADLIVQAGDLIVVPERLVKW
jgi:protein involved in polysaccharide export with SLBB domain